MRGRTFELMVRDTVTRFGDQPVLSFPGHDLSYGDLLLRGTERAAELTGLGVGRGDRFGVLLPNSVELVELMLGGAMIGATMVPINTRFKAAELAHVVADARLSALFTTDAVDEHVDFKHLLRQALPSLGSAVDPAALRLPEAPDLRAIALVSDGTSDGFLNAPRLREIASERVTGRATADDPLLIMYTSGTTAHPKGCVQANGAVVTNSGNIADVFQVTAEDRWWDPLPMFHMGGLLLLSVCLQRGAAFISEDHFDAAPALRLIGRRRPTVLYSLFPTITLSLIHHESFAETAVDQVRVVANLSPPDLQQQVLDAFPAATLVSAYGMTELCGTLAYSHLDDSLGQRLTTCGHLLPGWEARVVDPELGTEVPPGVEGELTVRGECMFDGYFGDPAQTAASFDADGYFHTGDRCSIGTDGLLRYHGRLKDMLKVGGENVSALEVESFLATHPAVKLAQVVGIPDDRYVEVPIAFVELVPGGQVEAGELIDYCQGNIARFKVPRAIRFVDEWPTSSTKVQKFRLRERALAEAVGPGA